MGLGQGSIDESYPVALVEEMLVGLKRHWNEFQRGHPGHRFRRRFDRNRETRRRQGWFAWCLKPFAAIGLIIAGVALCFIPGPGVPLILIGAGLLADVSRPVAVALDWLEVHFRDFSLWGRKWWRHASRAAKCAVILLAVFLVSGAAYGGFRIVMGRIH
jgi:hypothetical protein